jgi:hypothetical protein
VRVVVSVAVVAAAAIGGVALSPGADTTVNAVGEPLGSGGEFHAIQPARIFDSRVPSLDVAPLGRKRTATSGANVFDVQLVGPAGFRPFVDADADRFDDDVLAVAVNITVISPTQGGYLRAYGAGTAEGTTSVVNFSANSSVPNTAILRPGRDGKVSIRLVSSVVGTSHVAIDVSGWFSTSQYGTRGARLVPVSPARIYDSNLAAFGGTTRVGRTQTTVPIRTAKNVADGALVIPAADASMVKGAIVNITAVNTFSRSQSTFISALPDPVPSGAEPSTSNLNLLPGQVRANLSIVPVGSDGAIRVFNRQGEIRLVIDLVGYLLEGQPTDTRAGRVVPLEAPFRAFDTRSPDFFNQPLGPANAEDWSFESFAGDVKIGGEAVGSQLGLLGNLTATNLQRQYSWAPVESYISAYPSPASSSTAVPTISSVNFREGATVPNMVLLRYGTTSEGPNRVRFYNRAGYVDYLLDVYAVVLSD